MPRRERSIPYPAGAPASRNACSEPCDMLAGPCVCGAWHRIEDWSDEVVARHADANAIERIRKTLRAGG